MAASAHALFDGQVSKLTNTPIHEGHGNLRDAVRAAAIELDRLKHPDTVRVLGHIAAEERKKTGGVVVPFARQGEHGIVQMPITALTECKNG